MHKPSSLKDYVVASAIAVIGCLITLLYLNARRGYINLYIGNKVFASVGMMMIALVFLIGPLMRHFSWGGYYTRYRKEIGVVAAFLVVLHGLVSLFFKDGRFGLVSYVNRLDTFIPGLIGAVLLIALWISSRKRVMEWLGGKRWWMFQRWGLRVVILATLVHVIWMKYAGWKRWILNGGSADLAMPELPPASLLATSILAVVVVIRMIEYVLLYPRQGVSIHASVGQEQGPLGAHEAPVSPEHEHFSRSRIMRCVISAGFVLLIVWYAWLFAHGSKLS